MKTGVWHLPLEALSKRPLTTCGCLWDKRLLWEEKRRTQLCSTWRQRKQVSASTWKVSYETQAFLLLVQLYFPLCSLSFGLRYNICRQQAAGAEFWKLHLTPVYLQTWGVQATRQGLPRCCWLSCGLHRWGAFNRSVRVASSGHCYHDICWWRRNYASNISKETVKQESKLYYHYWKNWKVHIGQKIVLKRFEDGFVSWKYLIFFNLTQYSIIHIYQWPSPLCILKKNHPCSNLKFLYLPDYGKL